MPTIDLTRRADEAELEYKAVLSEVPLESESTRYTGVIYSLTTSSMHGTYIVFPVISKRRTTGFMPTIFHMRSSTAFPLR